VNCWREWGEIIDYIARINKLRRMMEDGGMEGLIITRPENRFYLSGFTGEDGILFISLDKLYLVTDSRYVEQAAAESPGWQVVEVAGDYLKALPDLVGGQGKVGFESRHITYDLYHKLAQHLEGRLKPCVSMVEELRKVKDEEELALIRKAVEIGDAAYRDILPFISIGVTEREIAVELERLLKVKGCSRIAFDTIAVSGIRASLPHGKPSSKRLEAGDMLTLDFGGVYEGYAGDTTRTIAIGEAPAYLRNVYQRVLEAQQAAIRAVRAGVPCREVDGAARDYLKAHGLDKYFAHSTGHGLGLQVHEEPAVGARSEMILQENMVITIEPGVYITGWGGVRIEDVVIVKETGCEIVTKAEKALVIL